MFEMFCLQHPTNVLLTVLHVHHFVNNWCLLWYSLSFFLPVLKRKVREWIFMNLFIICYPGCWFLCIIYKRSGLFFPILFWEMLQIKIPRQNRRELFLLELGQRSRPACLSALINTYTTLTQQQTIFKNIFVCLGGTFNARNYRWNKKLFCSERKHFIFTLSKIDS